jgi:hypothetical protein
MVETETESQEISSPLEVVSQLGKGQRILKNGIDRRVRKL